MEQTAASTPGGNDQTNAASPLTAPRWIEHPLTRDWRGRGGT
jgi:hypothetical protein